MSHKPINTRKYGITIDHMALDDHCRVHSTSLLVDDTIKGHQPLDLLFAINAQTPPNPLESHHPIISRLVKLAHTGKLLHQGTPESEPIPVETHEI